MGVHLLPRATAIFLWGLLFLTPVPGVTQEQAEESVVWFPASLPHTGANVRLKGELYRPAGPGPFPAVVLMHGCGGWQPAVRFTLRRYAETLNARGYAVLNLDSFGPRRQYGSQMCPDNARLRDALRYRTADAFDALRFLARLSWVDARHIFLMGQSNGGSVAIMAAESAGKRRHNADGPAFRGVVAYYPWCGGFGSLDLSAPLLVFAGGQDDWVSARECENMTARGAELRVIVYPQAAHSFDLEVMLHRYNGYLVGHDPAAARDSRTRMIAFFDAQLAGDLRAARLVTGTEVALGQ